MDGRGHLDRETLHMVALCRTCIQCHLHRPRPRQAGSPFATSAGKVVERWQLLLLKESLLYFALSERDVDRNIHIPLNLVAVSAWVQI